MTSNNFIDTKVKLAIMITWYLLLSLQKLASSLKCPKKIVVESRALSSTTTFGRSWKCANYTWHDRSKFVLKFCIPKNNYDKLLKVYQNCIMKNNYDKKKLSISCWLLHTNWSFSLHPVNMLTSSLQYTTNDTLSVLLNFQAYHLFWVTHENLEFTLIVVLYKTYFHNTLRVCLDETI